MKSSCFWWVVLNCVVHFCQTAPCFVPQMCRLGVAKIGHKSRYPSWSTTWCDDVMLCGRAPLSLRIVTVETTADRLSEVIERESTIDTWLLSIPDHINATQVLRPLTEHYQSQKKHFMDFSRRKLPETAADWCTLALELTHGKGAEPGASPMDVHVNYVLRTMEHAKLNKVVVVFDENTELQVARLSEGLSAMHFLHTLRKREARQDWVGDIPVHDVLPPGSRSNATLLDFDDFTNLVIWCGGHCVTGFLNEISWNADDLTEDIVLHHMTRILIVDSSIQSDDSSTYFGSQSNGWFGEQSRVSSDDDEDGDVMERLADILEIVQSFYHVAVLWKQTDCVRLQTLMTTRHGKRRFSYAGFGDNLGHMIMTSDVFPNSKWRLNRQKIFVGTAVWEPFVVVEEVNGTKQYGGFCIDILKALSFSLNFTYEVLVPEDGQYGSIKNGNWTGLVRMLKDKEVQMVVAPLAVNERRAAVVDFTTPFYLDYTGVLFKPPGQDETHRLTTYIKPFSYEVLGCIGASFLLATTFGHVLGVVSANVLLGGHGDTTMGLMDTVQYFFGSLLAQGGVWNPSTGSSRLFVSAWWLFCVVVAAIYSGNLTASLAVATSSPPFTTLQQMIDGGVYQFGTVPGTIWADIFEVSNRSDFRAISDQMQRLTQSSSPQMIDGREEHVAMAGQGHYAYVGNLGSLRLTVQRRCDLRILKETFLPLHYSIALQKGSPLTPAVSRWILRMTEGGLDGFWASQWWRTANSSCHLDIKTETKNLTLTDCVTAFYILFAGSAVALLAFLFELLVHHVRRRRRKERPETAGEGEVTPAVPQSDATMTAVSNGGGGGTAVIASVTLSDLDAGGGCRQGNGHANGGVHARTWKELDDDGGGGGDGGGESEVESVWL
ncbi:uncharacterized protein LOC143281489 [Babylonia areolata]|uniref:uncharacterized protein LOC143281489 n=1 Tax=Babylonia areolata TaxID=304850 RepID=UPI003FD62251